MLRRLYLTVLIPAVPVLLNGQPEGNDFFKSCSLYFRSHVHGGYVDYRAAHADTALAGTIRRQAAGFDLHQAGRLRRQAFYMNAYNFLVMDGIARSYPVTTPLDIDGFYSRQEYELAGRTMTLDALEGLVMQDGDPRVKFWLCNGTLGGPPPARQALTPENYDELLNARMHDLFNDPAYIRVDGEAGEVSLPMAFRTAGMTSGGDSLAVFLNRYRDKPLPAGFRTGYYAFNWSLNDLASEEEAEAYRKADRKAARRGHPAEETADGGSWPDPSADHVLSEATNMLTTPFQVRFTANLLTRHASYDKEWNRVNHDYRYSTFNMGLQCWSRVNDRFDIGVEFLTRTLQLSGYHSSPYKAVSFSNDTNRIFFLRHVMNSVKYLVYDRRFRLVALSAFLVPVSKTVQVHYDNNRQQDAVLAQWINQVLFAETFSRYFSLYGDVTSVSRFGTKKSEKLHNLRCSVMPEFSYWFGRGMRFYAWLDMSPQLNHGLFSNFYLREGAGLSLLPGEKWQVDLQFFYDAIGKKSDALNSFSLGGRVNL